MIALVFRRHFTIIVGLNEGAGNYSLSMSSLCLLITLHKGCYELYRYIWLFVCYSLVMKNSVTRFLIHLVGKKKSSFSVFVL